MAKFIISLGMINKKLLFPLIYFIIYIFVHIFNLSVDYNEVSVFLDGFGFSLGEISAFFVGQIIKYKRIDTKKKKIKKKFFLDYFFLFLINVFYMLMRFSPFFFLKKDKDDDTNAYKDLLTNDALEQILTIASFLEAESNPNDGAKVSSVIHNRLSTLKFDGKNNFGEHGFNFLQLDSTMYYPYRTKEEAPYNFKSIYNTYEIKGLPPGPICSPGLRFINDAINPGKTDYYYFCNDKEGKTYFAKDYQTHCKNLKLAGLR